MILLDDSFASIIKAVEQGRGVYANVKKMITYIFSHNMAELFPFVFAALGGVALVPLRRLQVLSIDLGSDVLPGLALGTELPEPGVMKLPPRARSERLLSRPRSAASSSSAPSSRSGPWRVSSRCCSRTAGTGATAPG